MPGDLLLILLSQSMCSATFGCGGWGAPAVQLDHPCDKEAQSPLCATVEQEMCEGPQAAMATN